MLNQESLTIEGYRSRQVPNRFLRQEGTTSHLAILLPGFSYSVDLPALFYPGKLMLELGADVLLVEYAYHVNGEFVNASAGERAEHLRADVTAAAAEGLRQRNYERVTLIGKSIGTLAIAALLAADERLRGADCVWLTPLVKDERLRAVVTRHRPRSLFIIGSADPHYDRPLFDQVIGSTDGESLVIEGANHSLEIPGDLEASIETMAHVVRAIKAFIAV